jgi:ATP-dependent helicase/nuclease subunit B
MRRSDSDAPDLVRDLSRADLWTAGPTPAGVHEPPTRPDPNSKIIHGTPLLLVTTFGSPATAALKQLVTDAKGGDPLAPVDVVIPSSVASVSVRRELADPGLVNVRFSLFPQLADRLAARQMALAGITALAPAARSLAVRTAIRNGRGPLAAAGAHASTAVLLEGLARELDDVEAFRGAHLERLDQAGARGAEVAAIYRAYRDEVASHPTTPEVLDAAREAGDPLGCGGE